MNQQLIPGEIERHEDDSYRIVTQEVPRVSGSRFMVDVRVDGRTPLLGGVGFGFTAFCETREVALALHAAALARILVPA